MLCQFRDARCGLCYYGEEISLESTIYLNIELPLLEIASFHNTGCSTYSSSTFGIQIQGRSLLLQKFTADFYFELVVIPTVLVKTDLVFETR